MFKKCDMDCSLSSFFADGYLFMSASIVELRVSKSRGPDCQDTGMRKRDVNKVFPRNGVLRILLFLMLPLLSAASPAADSICALVKIEIEQTLTLERQAFDARMAITNHLDTVELTDVKVDVLFADEQGNSVLASSDPNNTSATFFIRIDSLTNISDVSGNGTVAPNTEAEVHWLIIPAPGAGGSVASGKRYDVSAVLSFKQNGVAQEIAVAPDLIFVKPLPLLNLDYFLTHDVVADNPFTDPVEPPEPFVLGVRVANNGGGVAHNLSIDTAQPKIVENEQGLLIDFRITGAQLDNQPVEPVLLMDFGDIEAGQSRAGRWQMETTLSGTFVEFDASFSHADDLGGRLTSLIDTIDTHFLIHDVRVDLPGRDDVLDFLAQDGSVIRVYESEYVDTVVEDLSGQAALVALAGDKYKMTVPSIIGMHYVSLSDPYHGAKHLAAAYRDDGTQVPRENAWLTRKEGAGGNTQYGLSLFDYMPSSYYTLVFGLDVPGNEAPVIQFISDKTVVTGSTLSFLVEVSDPNRTIPQVTASPMPGGASLTPEQTDYDLSRYKFEWTPSADQTGTYTVVFRADDGALQTYQSVDIVVTSAEDTDGDGMPDAWEMRYFGSLAQDATTDFDGDGVSDLDEYLGGTDPTDPNDPCKVNCNPSTLAAHAGADRSILLGTASIVMGGYPAATGGTPPYSYDWSITPGSSNVDYAISAADETNPNFSGSKVGRYTLELTVTDADDNQHTDSEIVDVSILENSLTQGLALHGRERLGGCQSAVVEDSTIYKGATLELIAPVVKLEPGFRVEASGALRISSELPPECPSGP